MSAIVSNGNAVKAATVASPHTAPPPAPRWAHYDTDLSSILAFAPRGAPLEIVQIAGEGAHTYCVGLGLDVGDRLTRLNGGKDAVVVTTQDGRRVRLDLSVALLVEVEPAVPS